MYPSYPSPTQIRVLTGNMPNESKFEIDQSHQNAVPNKCEVFLKHLGWEPSQTHPDTGEQLFHKPPPISCSLADKQEWDQELQYSYWHWYEAMAYEFSKFMSIGDDTGGQKIGVGFAGTSTPK